MAAKAKSATSKTTKAVVGKPKKGRRVKTTRGKNRRLKNLKAPPTKRRRPRKKMSGAAKLKAKKARSRLKKLETPADKKGDKIRSKHLRDLRKARKGGKVAAKKGKGKAKVSAGKGKGKGHKLSLSMGRSIRKMGSRIAGSKAGQYASKQIKRLTDAIQSLYRRMKTAVSDAMRKRLQAQITKLEEQLAKVRADAKGGKATTKDVLKIKHRLQRKKAKMGTAKGFGAKYPNRGKGPGGERSRYSPSSPVGAGSSKFNAETGGGMHSGDSEF